MRIENCGCGGSCESCGGLGDVTDLSSYYGQATGPNWWQSLVKTGVDTASSILGSRYGVPPPGSSVTRMPDGSYQFIRSGAGTVGGAIGTFGGNQGIDTSTLLIAGVTILGGILIFKAIK